MSIDGAAAFSPNSRRRTCQYEADRDQVNQGSIPASPRRGLVNVLW